jgi:hypothetical protein
MTPHGLMHELFHRRVEKRADKTVRMDAGMINA